MKNVTLLTKLRRLVKSLAVSVVFLILGVAGSAFTNASRILDSGSEEHNKSGRDSSLTEKSFPELITASTDPVKPGFSLLNPKAVEFVQQFVRSNAERLNKMKVWGKPYFDIFDGIFAQHGLPSELKYLSVVESSLKKQATSPVGAGGPWQIMPTEARRLGLVVNGRVDERRNYYKSTHAAAKFLKELYGQFEDWLLVIAAYNCGPGRLAQAIRRAGSKDFWTLQRYLPLETRNHVKKFIATHYVFEGSGGLTTMTASEIKNYNVEIDGLASKSHLADEELQRTMAVEVNGKYQGQAIARVLGMDMATFNHLNPNFDKNIVKGPSMLRLPIDKMMAFDSKKQHIINESVKSLLK